NRLPGDVQLRMMTRLKKLKKSERIELMEEMLEAEFETLLAHGLSNKVQSEKQPEREEKPDDEALKCYFCDEAGHVATMCEAVAKISCSKCGKPGHSRKFCHKATEIGAICLISKHPEKLKRSGAESWRKTKAIETTTVSDHSVRCKVEVGKKEGVAV